MRDGRKLLDDVWGTELLRPMTCRAVTSNKYPNIEHVLLMFRTVITSIDVPCLPCCLSLVITGCHISYSHSIEPITVVTTRTPCQEHSCLAGSWIAPWISSDWDGFPIQSSHQTNTANSSTLFHLQMHSDEAGEYILARLCVKVSPSEG